MPRYIDADALKKVFERYLNAPHVQIGYNIGEGMRMAIKTCIELLDNERTIDAVPVVRCRECVYWDEAKVNRKGFLICPVSTMEIAEDVFCFYGERRSEDE